MGPQPGAHRLANLGVITIDVYRIASGEESRPSAKSLPAVEDLESVSEKLLKGRAISHQTRSELSLPVSGTYFDLHIALINQRKALKLGLFTVNILTAMKTHLRPFTLSIDLGVSTL